MGKKWISIFLSLIMITVTLVSCSMASRISAKPINDIKSIQGKEEILSVEELDKAYIDGLNGFAYDVFDQLSRGDNVFLSPYSIFLAISMLYNGADKETRVEMAKMLGFDQLSYYTAEYHKEANDYMNANAQYLMELLHKTDSKVTMKVANSIWTSKDAVFSETIDLSLLSPVRQYYNADIFQVDFRDDQTLKDVNQWVIKHTDGMIDPFLEEFQDKANMRLFLANAIYFNGKWANPFQKEHTRKYQFHGTRGEQTADMMFMHDEKYRYYNEKGLRGIEIPYGEERIVMNVIIPEDTQNATIGEIYHVLKAEDIKDFLSQLDKAPKIELGTLALPKFEMEYRAQDLNTALQELGMIDAFNDSNADFGFIGDNLFVSNVSHMAKIQVEEWGTKAAAATGIEMTTTAMPLDSSMDFIVDVPFLYIIRDRDTGAILFIGMMNNIE